MNNVNHMRSKSRIYQTKKEKKESIISCPKQARKGVMAVEEWKNENNRDLSFFRDEGITNSPCSTDTLDPPLPLHAVICGDDVRNSRLSRGSVRERGKVLWAWGFPAPHCLSDNLSLPEKKLIYEGMLEWQKMRDYQESVHQLLNKNRKPNGWRPR